MNTHRKHPGQSLVELAIALPILALLVFGGIDALQVLMTNYTVQRAARAAAHQAALDGGPSPQVVPIANLILDNGFGTTASRAQISVECPAPCQRYAPITVTITYRDRVWAPLGIWNEFTAQATTTRASERDRATTAGDVNCGLAGAPPCGATNQ